MFPFDGCTDIFVLVDLSVYPFNVLLVIGLLVIHKRRKAFNLVKAE